MLMFHDMLDTQGYPVNFHRANGLWTNWRSTAPVVAAQV